MAHSGSHGESRSQAPQPPSTEPSSLEWVWSSMHVERETAEVSIHSLTNNHLIGRKSGSGAVVGTAKTAAKNSLKKKKSLLLQT